MLDVLYQTKEYKRKLKNRALFDSGGVDEVEEYVNTNTMKLAKRASAIHEKKIKTKYGPLVTSLDAHSQLGMIVTLTEERQ